MENSSWDDLGLSSPVLSAIGDLGFDSLTPVQASCIPLFLKRSKDVAVEAVTGSGKTLAFLVPMFELLLRQGPFKKNDVAAIVISPTRELAAQTYEIANLFIKHMPQFTCILLIGGGAVSADIRKILEDGANIIIATPGRLADLFQNKGLRMPAYVKALEMLILDEADHLLDLGFERTLNTILSYLPKQRQTGLFSATQTKEIEDLIRAGLRNPVTISVKEKTKSSSIDSRTPVALSNFYMICEADKKFSQLIEFLKQKEATKCMVFFSTCASVNYFGYLMQMFIKHIPVISIHGKMRRKRHQIFSNFKNSDSGILLCTDVMARGVDIPDVQWVIQFDPPSSANSFVHRCGRTARIGKTGNALLMLLPNEECFVNFLDVNQKIQLKEMNLPFATHLTPLIIKEALKDRDIYEKGIRAFVSFIRFYSKHECSLIFRIKELDLGKLANGYSLLKLPRMPELKNKSVPDFVPVDVNIEEIPFLDKDREKHRLKQLKEFQDNPELRKKFLEGKNKHKKAKLEAKKQLARKQMSAKKKKRKRCEATPEDIEDLATDARLLKKFKKGKISKEEFDAEFAPDVQEDFEV